ncbi:MULTISPECIES: hypothetical protein [unclassified Bradyrhizobium]|uniref:Uncharacterized protein n=1 Tax=Bradyrhizobium sp. LLZ17 TaxID=3239388 RepID=A0AB39XIB3_9BRAD|nr:hypothetical protein [Bradyrhizobium sp. WSM1417]
MAAILLVVSSFMPVAASAQQTAPDANQTSPQARPEVAPQQPDKVQAQKTPVQPDRTPQQSEQARDRDRQSAEDTRINRDWTTRQSRGDDRMDMDRMRQMHRQMGRMMDQDEDHRTIGQNWRREDDDIDRGSGYASPGRGEGRYEGRYHGEMRPYPRVKTCIEYENGDEFCRYRD